ncbi:MAG: hypothetical protein ACI8RD_010947, partial [Bacillariaceae sp.]
CIMFKGERDYVLDAATNLGDEYYVNKL